MGCCDYIGGILIILGLFMLGNCHGNIQVADKYPCTDYVVELSMADGSKQTVIDKGNDRWASAPKLKSPIFHQGYYANINGEDVYGVTNVKVVGKQKSSSTYSILRDSGVSRYDLWKINKISFWNACFNIYDDDFEELALQLEAEKKWKEFKEKQEAIERVGMYPKHL